MNKLIKKFVQYARVSTDMQEYGLDAQKRKMDEYVKSVQGETIALFQEKESGRKNKRRQLQKAIEHCKIYNATLLVSKLDRLGRITKELLDHRDNLNLVVAENPDLNSNTLFFGITAIISQHEAELISARIKDGMVEAKEAGKIAGWKKDKPLSINHKKRISKALNEVYDDTKSKIQQFANEFYNDIQGNYQMLVALMKAAGFKNRNGDLYNIRRLKELGISIGKVIKRKAGRKKKLLIQMPEPIAVNSNVT